MTKIEIKDLSILFGPEKAKAKKMVKQGKSKQEILKETGCTIVVVSRRWCVALTG